MPSFPSSPTQGQTATKGGRTYSWSGKAWEFVGSSGGSGSGSASLVYAATPSGFPATGSADNLYISTDTQRIFRWATSVYVECGPVGGGLSWGSAPTLPNSTGSAGDLAWDGSYLYLATGTNAWRRVSLPAWDVPTAIPGIQLWLDASYAPSLYDATSGGSLVAADGSVARWEDRSGNGRHATQGTSGSRPLRKTSVQGGKDVLRFDGSDDFLSIPSSTSAFKFLHDGTSTLFIVYKWTSPGSSPDRRQLLSNCSNSESVDGTTGSFVWLRNDFGTSSPYSKAQFVVANNGSTRSNSYTGDNSFPAGTFQVLTVESDPANSTNANRVIFRNNGTVKDDTAAGDGASVPTGNATYDLHLCTQGGPDGRYYAQADLCEVILYDSTLSDTDRSAIEQYLISKWGIS